MNELLTNVHFSITCLIPRCLKIGFFKLSLDYSVAVVSEYGVMITSLLKLGCLVLKLWDEKPLHTGYTFANTKGLVIYLLQDHSIVTEKTAGFHTTP